MLQSGGIDDDELLDHLLLHPEDLPDKDEVLHVLDILDQSTDSCQTVELVVLQLQRGKLGYQALLDGGQNAFRPCEGGVDGKQLGYGVVVVVKLKAVQR